MTDTERTCISYWLPKLQSAGVPVPRTEIVRTDCELWQLLDGKLPDGWEAFMAYLHAAVERMGTPCFLRTGQGSGKHEWRDTCFVADMSKLPSHVAALVDWSGCVDLPTNMWAVREFLSLETAFTLPGYSGMPVAREFRCFVRDGMVRCCHPYWPVGAVAAGKPDPGWQAKLVMLSTLGEDEGDVRFLAGQVATAFRDDGGWSVDCCKTVDGRWLVTDLAVAERSFHWEGCTVALS